MVPVEGAGFALTILIYFGGLFAASKISLFFGIQHKTQVLLLIVVHFALSALNYMLARTLNKKEVRHTVAGLRLEKVILFLTLIFTPLILMMIYKEFFG